MADLCFVLCIVVLRLCKGTKSITQGCYADKKHVVWLHRSSSFY